MEFWKLAEYYRGGMNVEADERTRRPKATR